MQAGGGGRAGGLGTCLTPAEPGRAQQRCPPSAAPAPRSLTCRAALPPARAPAAPPWGCPAAASPGTAAACPHAAPACRMTTGGGSGPEDITIEESAAACSGMCSSSKRICMPHRTTANTTHNHSRIRAETICTGRVPTPPRPWGCQAWNTYTEHPGPKADPSSPTCTQLRCAQLRPACQPPQPLLLPLAASPLGATLMLPSCITQNSSAPSASLPHTPAACCSAAAATATACCRPEPPSPSPAASPPPPPLPSLLLSPSPSWQPGCCCSRETRWSSTAELRAGLWGGGGGNGPGLGGARLGWGRAQAGRVGLNLRLTAHTHASARMQVCMPLRTLEQLRGTAAFAAPAGTGRVGGGGGARPVGGCRGAGGRQHQWPGLAGFCAHPVATQARGSAPCRRPPPMYPPLDLIQVVQAARGPAPAPPSPANHHYPGGQPPTSLRLLLLPSPQPSPTCARSHALTLQHCHARLNGAIGLRQQQAARGVHRGRRQHAAPVGPGPAVLRAAAVQLRQQRRAAGHRARCASRRGAGMPAGVLVCSGGCRENEIDKGRGREGTAAQAGRVLRREGVRRPRCKAGRGGRGAGQLGEADAAASVGCNCVHCTWPGRDGEAERGLRARRPSPSPPPAAAASPPPPTPCC